MTHRAAWIAFLVFLTGAAGPSAPAQRLKVRFENQLSTWASANFSDTMAYRAGGRYLPTLSLIDSLGHDRVLDAEISVNAFAEFFFKGDQRDGLDKDFTPYRAWIRYASPRLEIRAGLQKISFGSSTVLRPLMWFDKMDVRDPLQLTEGVYSLLGRYYFQNNANIWLWALYGNDKAKGWEVAPTREKKPELGGRFQFPLPRGEAALSFHWREADFKALFPPFPDPGDQFYQEQKVGIDGKWDLGVGLAFEAVLKHNDAENPVLREWEAQVSLGLDYTFKIGNGLSLATEYFRYDARDEWKDEPQTSNYSVLTANYPINLLNTVAAMVYYNWDDKEWYRMLSIQRKYDFLSFYLIAFWNPDSFNLYGPTSERNLFAGKGVQLMIVINN